MGATDEVIDKKREAKRKNAEVLTGEVILWPDLVDAFIVFPRCKWDVVAGGTGAFWNGIPTAEVETVARIAGVECDIGLLDDIRIMADEASKILNKRES